MSHVGDDWLTIDCRECPRLKGIAGVRESEFCDDCMVGYLSGRDRDDAIIIDVVEERALRALDRGGLFAEVVERRRIAPAVPRTHLEAPSARTAIAS